MGTDCLHIFHAQGGLVSCIVCNSHDVMHLLQCKQSSFQVVVEIVEIATLNWKSAKILSFNTFSVISWSSSIIPKMASTCSSIRAPCAGYQRGVSALEHHFWPICEPFWDWPEDLHTAPSNRRRHLHIQQCAPCLLMSHKHRSVLTIIL